MLRQCFNNNINFNKSMFRPSLLLYPYVSSRPDLGQYVDAIADFLLPGASPLSWCGAKSVRPGTNRPASRTPYKQRPFGPKGPTHSSKTTMARPLMKSRSSHMVVSSPSMAVLSTCLAPNSVSLETCCGYEVFAADCPLLHPALSYHPVRAPPEDAQPLWDLGCNGALSMAQRSMRSSSSWSESIDKLEEALVAAKEALLAEKVPFSDLRKEATSSKTLQHFQNGTPPKKGAKVSQVLIMNISDAKKVRVSTAAAAPGDFQHDLTFSRHGPPPTKSRKSSQSVNP
ncbi:hypothetical protein NA56DRAFT_697990 [Hyaloscypha hepaticicola]|uniref:Uncharacterized protein n=1 Tax=Hyaloscypha hepaticicola TaxID=2082293 RepID=A0A2J6QKF7_9HELO|nr:hypothetical protein NA56DRAFT_697990 [Hyaloscypha hepaticicola]